MIYLIESENYYKIGYTKDLNQRLKSYNTVNPDYVVLLVEEGEISDETELHNLCKKFHYKLEWFHKNPEIINIWNNYFTEKKNNSDVCTINISLLNNPELYNLSKAEFNVLSVMWFMASTYYSNHALGNRISCDKQFRDIVHNKTNLAESTIKAAIADLVKKNMLIKDKDYKGVYYLNPDYFFKGKLSDRNKIIKQITEYIINE